MLNGTLHFVRGQAPCSEASRRFFTTLRFVQNDIISLKCVSPEVISLSLKRLCNKTLRAAESSIVNCRNPLAIRLATSHRYLYSCQVLTQPTSRRRLRSNTPTLNCSHRRSGFIIALSSEIRHKSRTAFIQRSRRPTSGTLWIAPCKQEWSTNVRFLIILLSGTAKCGNCSNTYFLHSYPRDNCRFCLR